MKTRRNIVLVSVLTGLLAVSGSATATGTRGAQAAPRPHARIAHVLLLSVDGMHAIDLAHYISTRPGSTLAHLARTGVTYAHATTSKPSDSFPGLLAEVTGGTPRSTGVYYDDSYDRTLAAPGSNCATKGTETLYDESVDKNSDLIDGGGGINPAALPRDPAHGCAPVYPHSFLRVNTVFEVAKAAGLRTAWSDKHPAYDLVNGPSGRGVDDLYTPEIAATKQPDGKTCLYADCLSGDSSVTDTIQYDTFKVHAILNEIAGKDHSGATTVGVPAIFGMNFQALSVAQKSPTGGYLDARATPSWEVRTALDFVDASLGQMVAALKTQGLYASTLIIVTAKHGQAPIDRRLLQKIGHPVPAIVNGVQPKLVAQATEDDVALLWLSDQSKTAAAVAALQGDQAGANTAHIQTILAGSTLRAQFGSPRTDPRVPDIIVLPKLGVIYTASTASKIAEHGGFSRDDARVALLISHPGLEATTEGDAVQTTQIAPTILKALGLKPRALQAVRLEHTHVLPGPRWSQETDRGAPTQTGRGVDRSPR